MARHCRDRRVKADPTRRAGRAAVVRPVGEGARRGDDDRAIRQAVSAPRYHGAAVGNRQIRADRADYEREEIAGQPDH